MQRTTIDLWVGVFVAAGLAGLLVLALKVGNASTVSVSEGYTVTADFDNIGGLKVRAPVKSAGVVVGRVENINFNNKNFRATVTMRLAKQFEFPKDSSSSILTAGLLGEQYVGIDGGGDIELLADGDKIRLTQSAIVLEKVIGQFLYSKAAEAGSGQ
jgi:phospholipid/cholesterol/gamma-HCH transport system substrate-binding protein